MKKENNKPKAISISISNLADPFETASFCNFDKLESGLLDQTGLYCIRLKSSSKLPARYQQVLNGRDHAIIYIGKAHKQSLRGRLSQEIYHERPGTFFRSIGAVLGFTPIPGHLKGMSNKKNYKFSRPDTEEITKWLLKNTEFCIYPLTTGFSIEYDLITKYCPLLNDKHNAKSLNELKEDRKKCREIVIGK